MVTYLKEMLKLEDTASETNEILQTAINVNAIG